MNETFEEVDERELLEQALSKKLRALRRPVTPARIYSLCQSLMRQGFRSDDIMKAVRSRPELKLVSDEVAVEEEE